MNAIDHSAFILFAHVVERDGIIVGLKQKEKGDRMRTTALALLVMVTVTAATLTAKGATVRLAVTGPGLQSPIMIDSPDALQANVFEGNFIGSSASEPDPTLGRYSVSFYVEAPRQAVRMMYVLSRLRFASVATIR